MTCGWHESGMTHGICQAVLARILTNVSIRDRAKLCISNGKLTWMGDSAQNAVLIAGPGTRSPI